MIKQPRKSARQHTKIEPLSFAGLTMRFGPVGLIVYADHFLAAAKSTPRPGDSAGVPARLCGYRRMLSALTSKIKNPEQRYAGPGLMIKLLAQNGTVPRTFAVQIL
jgi:hypothetical protein